MIQVTLRLKVPNSWFSDIAEKYSTSIKILACKTQIGGDGCSELIEIIDSGDNVKEIVESLKNHPDVSDVEIAPSRKGCILGAIKTNQCSVCTALHSAECFLIASSTNKNGDVEWKIISPNEKAILELVENLRKSGIKSELVSKAHIDQESFLTVRQENIIHVAYKRGYFDYPKRINIRELARIFDVSISTMSEILRKGEKKIIGKYFKDI